MIHDNYIALQQTLLPDYNVPAEFFSPAPGGETHCIFFISCLSTDKFLYLDETFQDLTGYSNASFMKGGMDLWFSLICPEDMPSVTERIIAAHKAMFDPGFDPGRPAPLILDYRFRHAAGHWAAIRDTRYLISFNDKKVIDKVLCRFEALPVEDTRAGCLDELLRKDGSCTKMLEVAMVHQHSQNKKPLDSSSPQMAGLTKREKQILQLIGEGLSTKMIAEKCNISINTVETHRRHLLEKLNVKNSMQLIKEASKVFWL
jgi:DNA-binding CsgD family transcriptional regulator